MSALIRGDLRGRLSHWLADLRRAVKSHPLGHRTLEREERRGLIIGAWVRIVLLGTVLVWMTIFGDEPPEVSVFYNYIPVGVFLALGLAQLVICRRRLDRLWIRFAFAGGELLVLTVFLFFWDPLGIGIVQHPVHLREVLVLYYALFVLGSSFTLSPRLVLFVGVVAIACWLFGMLSIALGPVATFGGATGFDGTLNSLVARLSQPTHVSIAYLTFEGIFLASLVATLTILVARLRGAAVSYVNAEGQRTQLARYFPPQIVSHLMSDQKPWARTERRQVALLFVDIRGFTTLCEHLSPEQAMELLRDFHQLMERTVFDHGGMVEKFIADAQFAVFGVPLPGDRDATNALGCARAMLAALAAWNAERAGQGEPPVEVGIGLHYGPAVMGDIGSERQVAFTVIGDAVNTASRLEALSRPLEAHIVASLDFVEAARGEGAPEALVTGLVPGTPQAVRGKRDRIEVWLLPRDIPAVTAEDVR